VIEAPTNHFPDSLEKIRKNSKTFFYSGEAPTSESGCFFCLTQTFLWKTSILLKQFLVAADVDSWENSHGAYVLSFHFLFKKAALQNCKSEFINVIGQIFLS